MTSWQPVDVVDAARCLIGAATANGQTVDLDRLQRLCYYAQGCFLAFHVLPLFDAPILAGREGPEIAAVASAFSRHCGGSIPASEGRDPMSLGVLAGMTLTARPRELPLDCEAGYIQEAHEQPLWATIQPGAEIDREALRLHFVDAFEHGLPDDERMPRDRQPIEYIEIDGRLLLRHPSRAGEPLPQLA